MEFKDLLLKADELFQQDARKEAQESYKGRKFSTFNTVSMDGKMILVGRSTESQPAVKLLLLNQGSLMGKLTLLEYHDKYHGFGANYIAAKIREKYNFAHINKPLRGIARNCFMCKKMLAKEASQQMSPQKDIRFQTMVPPFTNIMLDYAGPIIGYDEVKRRTSKMFWFLLLTCISTRSLKVVLIPSMRTDDFIIGLRELVAEHAVP